ncbi:uncharacterized protein FFFS_02244 [Fusarium fujikuroi]|nr:uncharacterized protein FFC1_07579 [Fusarium fujikuroi]SCV30356.1 uncharacterized protein FFFS_02244 [Fusarium fujikuroi]
MSGGHYSLDTSEVEEHQLQGKTNYIEWRRYFDRAAKGHDLWSLVTTESVLKEPKEEDYIAYFDVPYKGPSTRKKGEALRDDELKIDSNKSFFLWQAAYRRWERQKERVRLVRRLIAKSVVSSIANEIEDMASPLQQVNHIKNTYGVTDEYARSVLLDKITALKLSHCSSMSDYINQHRDLKTDLVRAGLPYSDSQMATNLIHGLPKSYNDFTKLWNFHRSQAIGTEPDIHFLLDRLLNEEASHEQEKSGGNKNKGGTAPKNNKVCTHKDCGKPGHEEKDCWIAHPEKMPQRIKDKQKENSSSGDTPNKSSNKQPDKPKGIVAMAKSAGALHDAMVSHTSNSSMFSSYPTDLSPADSSPQPESDGNELGCGSGELLLGNTTVRIERRLSALLAEGGVFSDRDTILLDSGADICIFNDKRWFSSIKPLDISVSSVENTQCLQIEGGGSVTISLVTTDDDVMPLTILEAAYAPSAKYNIVSMSYLAKRAKICGKWNESCVTLEYDGCEVGQALLIDGLYHLSVKPSLPAQTAFVGSINYDHPVWIWHRRLGHLSLQNMVNLLDVSNGIPLTKQQIRAQMMHICPICATSRALLHIPRDPATRRQKELRTDDATRWTTAKPMVRKSDLLTVFRDNHYQLEVAYGIVVRCYRFDTEFANGPVGKWLNKKHIPFEPTVPYAHYMGGTHERVNRIIREKAAPMIQEQSISGQLTKIITGKALETIQETKLPENLWVEAMRYSVWLKNRSPTRALKDKTTPWEAVYGIKPIFGRESIWGSRIYVTLPPETDRVGKPKLHHARGWVGYFVGCDSESIYRIYSDEHHRVFRVGVGRIQQGQGVEDEHDGLSYNDRVGREGSQIPIIPSPSSIQEESSQDNQPDDQAIDNFWHESDSDRSDPANPSEHACEDDWETDEEEEGDEHHEPHGQSSDKNLPDNPPSSESYHSSDNNVFEKSKYFAAVLQLPQDYKPPDSSDESDTEQHNDKSQIVKREMRLLAPGTEILDEPCYFCYVYGRRSGKNCAYIVQQGLMEKFYPVTQAAKDKFKSYSEDSCRWCIVTPSARCDTEQPCRICVMACARLTYTRCVYRREDHLEKYSASAFMLDSNGRVVLKENWEDFTINKINALHAKNWDKKKNTPLTEKHLHSSITLNADADTATVTVPEYVNIIPTEVGNLECGFYSLVNSITSQIPQHPPPTFQELRDIFSGPEMTSRNEAAGLHNSNNLTADQVAGVLQIWGNSRNLSLQLGVLIDGGEHLIIRGPENSRTIWIHNDNANEGNPDTFNHYSGVDIPTHAQSDNNLSDSDSHSDFQPENDIDDDITFFSSNKHVLHVQKDLASEPEPTTYAAAMKCAESSHWERAIYAEKQSHDENGTFLIVDLSEIPEECVPLHSRWVFKKKLNQFGVIKRYKARLVIKGYAQREGIDYEETFSAVIKATSYRILFALAARLGWKIFMMDVVTAFLNGKVKEKIFMKPPPGWKLPKGKVLQVVKSLYGLKQAPRVWYEKLCSEIAKWGFRKSSYDACVFIHDEWQIVMGVWVDDCIILAPSDEIATKLRMKLEDSFQMKDEGLCEWYLGMHVLQDENGVTIHQEKYINQMLRRFDLDNIKSKSTPLTAGLSLTKNSVSESNEDLITDYQQKVGSLVYLAGQSRPDICFAANYCARYMSNPSRDHHEALNEIFAYLKRTAKTGFRYRKGDGSLNLVGFADSDFGGCLDSRRSTTGWIFLLGNAPISWSSQRQKTVALSTTDAEYVAASEAAKEAIWIRGFVNNLQLLPNLEAVTLYVDNEGARKLSRNPEFHNRTKYIDIRHHFIRERVESGELDTQRVDTLYNIADLLTKPLGRVRLQQLTAMMGMIELDKDGNQGGSEEPDQKDLTDEEVSGNDS